VKLTSFKWLVALVEVMTFLWFVVGVLICTGAIMQQMLSTDALQTNAVPAMAISGSLGILGLSLGLVVRQRLLRRYPEGPRGFAVLPPR
jgi:hypothetical protein